MEYDNERDRYANGFDAGQVVSGTVELDESTGRYIVVDSDGIAFDMQRALETLAGQEVRVSLVTMKAMIDMEQMMRLAQESQNLDNKDRN